MAKNLFLHFHKKTNNMVIKVSSCFVASDGSAVVEHLSHHSKVIGLSLATAISTRRGKMAANYILIRSFLRMIPMVL
jgi:hypothetical protein